MINFRKLLPTGFAVAAGLMATVSVAQANTTLTYDSGSSVDPQLKITIDDHGYSLDPTVEGFTINISSMDGRIDVFALAWDFVGTEVFQLPASSTTLPTDGTAQDLDVFLTGAWTPPGSEGLSTTGGTLNTAVDDLSSLDRAICNNSSSCTSDPDGNFSGKIVFDFDNAPNSDFENIYVVGVSGATESSEASDSGLGEAGLDEVELFIKYVGADLYDEENDIITNPFSNLALRGKTLQGDGLGDDSGSFPNPDFGEPGEPEFLTGQGSIKINFPSVECTAGCDPTFPFEPQDVPEIDGPVLIQVGFALGGLYLLLLGRRRQEDELAQAA